MQKIHVCFLLFLIISINSFSQVNTQGGIDCGQAGPICADGSGSFVFQNNNDSSTNINTPVACLLNAPRPAWFFFRVDQTGDLEFDIIQTATNGGGLDVDFVVWGPFSSETGNCNNININCSTCPDNTVNPNFYINDLDNSNIVDCSFSPLTTETMTIPNAISGDNYVLLVSNFRGGNGIIEIVQTNFSGPNGGSTDCSVINVNGILGEDQNICELTSTTLDANPNSDPDFVDFAWEFDDGTGFIPIPGTDGMSTITVSDAGQYQITVTDSMSNFDDDIIELVVTQIPTANPVPNNSLIECDNDNDGFFEFDFTTLDTTIIGGQTGVNVSYYTSLLDAEIGNNPIGLYTNTVAFTAESIFFRIENSINSDCASTGTFVIDVLNGAIANPVNDQLICDDNNDGFWDFNLDAIRATVLGTQVAADYTVTFHLTQADADASSITNPLPDNYTNIIAYGAETIFVRVDNNNNALCFNTASFNIDVFDAPTANPVENQLQCDDNNDGFWDFDLAVLEADVLDMQNAAQFDITFHTSQNDADMNLMPLASPYTNQNAYQQETIFVRIENVDNVNCADTTTNFEINVFETPIANMVENQLQCDDDNDGFWDFDLNALRTTVLGSQSTVDYTVTFHPSQLDADNSTFSLPNTYTNIIAYTEEAIFVRIENNANSICFSTTSFNIDVFDSPIANPLMSQLICDDDNDGFWDFDLDTLRPTVLGIQLNTEFNVSFHTSQLDADNDINPLSNLYTNATMFTAETIFVRIENNDNSLCADTTTSFEINVFETPIVNVVEDQLICDDDNDGFWNFDLDALRSIVLGTQASSDFTITFHSTQVDADASSTSNTLPDDYLNMMAYTAETIFIRIENNGNIFCFDTSSFEIDVFDGATANAIMDQPVCDEDGDGFNEFDLSLLRSVALGTQSLVDYSVSFHNSQFNADTGANPLADLYTNTSAFTFETVFARVESNISDCFDTTQFELQVNPLPNTIAVTDFVECENNTDFFVDFNLENKTDEILNGQDPAVFSVAYYESQQDADNLTNPIIGLYENMSNPQIIFAAITNNMTGCSISTISFNIEVFEGAIAMDTVYEECDIVGENNGSTQFDLASQSPIVLAGQDPLAFSISYHFTEDNAINNVEPLPLLYENLVNPQIIYARVSNNLRPDVCFEIAEVTLQTNLLPMFNLDDEYILCLTSNDEAVVPLPPVLDTQLSVTDYTFEWSLNGTVIPTEIEPSLIPTQGGIYDVLVTDITTSIVTMCTNFDSTEVIESGIPDTFDVEVTSQAFTNSNMIIATASGNSTYEFSLDNGPWQLDGEFEDVSGGDHLVLVRDINGCGILTRNVTVIDYPKFFTPNGDGNNDTWTISGIDSQPSAVIYIFDRYGKLLKQLSPTSPGWDGTYNGNNMPSSDYWFSLQYREPINNEQRTLKANFTLKR